MIPIAFPSNVSALAVHQPTRRLEYTVGVRMLGRQAYYNDQCIRR
jgi:hypothetical protein